MMDAGTGTTASVTAVSQAKEQSRPARRGLWWIALALCLLAVWLVGVTEVSDPDLWWHMATGRLIVTEHRVPTQDVFSYTATDHRWVTHEWLSDVLLYLGYRAIGLAGLQLLFPLLIAAAFGLVFLRCKAPPVIAAGSVLLAAFSSALTWGVRPQMLTLLMASLYLYILDRDTNDAPEGPGDGSRTGLGLARSNLVWFLPPLMLLWANLHSGFLAGLAIIAVYVVGEEVRWLRRNGLAGGLIAPRAKRLALVGVVSGASALITPNGISAALFPFGTLSNKLIQNNIQEWLSPDFHTPAAWFLAEFWLALLLTAAVARRRAGFTEVVLVLGASVMTLYSMRHVQFLALTGAPLLAAQTAALWPWKAQDTPRKARPVSKVLRGALALSVALLLVAGAVHVGRVMKQNGDAERKLFPQQAVAYLQEHDLRGPIFNTYHWGGYLIWNGFKVFADGRAEVYGDEVLGDYLRVTKLEPGWEEPLRSYGVQVVLVEAGKPLAQMLQECGRWSAVYRDELAIVFVPAANGGSQ